MPPFGGTTIHESGAIDALVSSVDAYSPETIDRLKAPRRIPDTSINPDGVQMRRFEREGKEQIAAALTKLQRDLFRGINQDNVQQVTTRLSDPVIMQPFQDTITALIQEWALAGADFGREQIEREAFGTIS